GRHEAQVPAVAVPPPPSGPTERVPLGRLFGARSGDKGGNANVGVWARSGPAYAWLERELGVERFRALVPDAAGLPVERHPLPSESHGARCRAGRKTCMDTNLANLQPTHC